MDTLTPTSLSELIASKNSAVLKTAFEGLSGFEIADTLQRLPLEDQLFAFRALNPALAVETLTYLSPRMQKKILVSLPTFQTASILREMPPDELTALLQKLPRPIINEYIQLLPEEERLSASKLLSYPKGSVGRLMTTDYVSVKMDWSAAQVLDRVREYGYNSETIGMLYVVDDKNRLIDDIQTVEFLFVPQDALVRHLANSKFTYLNVYDKAEKAIDTFKQNDRTALPVINKAGEMLGVVTIDDILRLQSKKTTENMQKIGGVEALDEAYMEAPFSELIMKRARWLVVLFVGELLTATAMGFYEAELAKAVVLALFLPLIISSGGNAGSQSSTLIIRAMALGEVKLTDWWRVMKRELLCGLALGLILGLIGFLRVTIWSSFSDIYGAEWLLIALTIGFSLIGVVLWGSLTGSMLPLLLKRCGADPATSSTPLVATLVDVTGIIIYFGIALLLLQGTLL